MTTVAEVVVKAGRGWHRGCRLSGHAETDHWRGDAMSEYHEKWDALPAETKDLHRALKSLQEELEAVDWYNQRLAVAEDGDLKAILEHNRDEEIEHAAMMLEWLRRRMDCWDEELRAFLFTTGSISDAEKGHDGSDRSLGIGNMKGDE
jgi:ferritin-like protein